MIRQELCTVSDSWKVKNPEADNGRKVKDEIIKKQVGCTKMRTYELLERKWLRCIAGGSCGRGTCSACDSFSDR